MATDLRAHPLYCSGQSAWDFGGHFAWDFGGHTPWDLGGQFSWDFSGQLHGIFHLESTFHTPAVGSSWINSGIVISSINGVTTNHGDNEQMVFDALAWSMAHQNTTDFASTMAPPMRKTVFMRAGEQWTNTFGLTFPASPTFTEVQLSLLDNAATRGDAQGTVPVFKWTAGTPYAGAVTLSMVLKQRGRFQLGILGIDNSSPADWSMFELDIIAV